MRMISAITSGLALALIPAGTAVAQTAPATAQEDSQTSEEIVVTALKRGAQAVSDTPAAISAFPGEELERIGADSLSDFIQTAPGVGIIESQTGTNAIQIRGISAQIGDATVGFYLYDMPVTLVAQVASPDARSFDLERVEVLRGPQGTLYGASSQGGTVRILTQAPNLSEVEAKGDFSASSTEDGSENYSINGALNMPLVEDRLAVRVAGTYSEIGGWIDDPVTAATDINDSEIATYRARALFTPTNNLSLTASAWISRVDNGSPNQSTADGLRPGAGTGESTEFGYDLYSFVAEYDAGDISFFNALSSMRYEQDLVTTVPLASDTAFDTDAITNEFRATSEFTGPLNFMLGAFYADSETEIAQDIMGTPSQRDTVTSESWAAFGEVYFEPNDRWEFTAGLRYFEDERSTADHLPTTSAFLGLLGFPNPRVATFDTLTPRFNVAYHASEDALFYVNIAQGFRSGAHQPGVSLISAGLLGVLGDVPTLIEPETLWSYEGGVKLTSMFGGAVDLEAALYYNDWEDLILFLPLAGYPTAFAVNGPAARSYGLDFVLTARPAEGLRLSFGGNINEAEYAESQSIFAEGDRIDNVPAMTLNASIDYERPLTATLSGFGHVDVQYTADRRLRSFAPTVPTPLVIDAESDAITSVSARIGVQSERWTLALFGENLTDEDGSVSPVSAFTPLGVRLSPPTVGLNLKLRY
jgi:iron complex outermembrane recepter protein